MSDGTAPAVPSVPLRVKRLRTAALASLLLVFLVGLGGSAGAWGALGWAVGATAVVLCFCVFATLLFTLWIERRYPPPGRMVRVGTARLHVVEQPGAPHPAQEREAPIPVLVLHGASGNLFDQWAGPHASGLGPAIFVDRPGHGYSTRGGRSNDTPEGQARTMVALLDVLGMERAVVLGHSYAGAVAAAMALHHPERVAGLVLVSPVTHPWPGGQTLWYYDVGAMPVIGPLFAWTALVPFGLRRVACAVRGVFAPQPVPPDYAERAATALALRPGNFLANAADLTHLHASVTRLALHWGTIAVPTVVIAGEEDRIVWTGIHARAFGGAVRGARLVCVPGLGHKPDYWTPDLLSGAVEAVRRNEVARFKPVIVPPPSVPDAPETFEGDARGSETGPDTPPRAEAAYPSGS